MAVEAIFGIDIETAKHTDYMKHEGAGLDPFLSKIRLIQLYAGTDTVFVFDMNSCKMETLFRIKTVAKNYSKKSST